MKYDLRINSKGEKPIFQSISQRWVAPVDHNRAQKVEVIIHLKFHKEETEKINQAQNKRTDLQNSQIDDEPFWRNVFCLFFKTSMLI